MSSSKYDRQLRLWGAEGQEALSTAHVVLVGANAAGTETLKNLVLPGIGEFTIVDSEVVKASDLRSNFFVRASDLGKERGAVAAELLGSLNVDVTSHFRSTLENDDGDLRGYSLVVAAENDPAMIESLAARCWAAKVPLVVVRSSGFVGSVRVQVRDLEIVESKPDHVRWDLRIAEPFDELKVLADDPNADRPSHVPYVLLLVKLIEQWKRLNNGNAPKTFAEKNAFKAFVEAAAPEPNLQNYEEALNEAYRAWTDPRDLPEEARDALARANDGGDQGRTREQEQHEEEAPTPLTLTLRAIAKWSAEKNDGVPPLAGAVPDLHSDTQSFIALQRAYAAKAKRDVAGVTEALMMMMRPPTEATEATEGGEPLKGGVLPDAAFVERVCRHLADVKIVSTTSLAAELGSPPCFDRDELVSDDLMSASEKAPRFAYLALRAADTFFKTHNRWPAEADDAPLLKKILLALFPPPPDAPTALDATYDAWAAEFVRSANAELHSVAAAIGGVASQEAVKIIAKQFTPLRDAFIFDGTSGSAAALPLGQDD
mmetsp:Transcript_21126/g.68111  ORF Transcript_21126/g.68111 Transcript_21126/m.68111 type:complete len:543 (-) Transcript_21126:122-1750(-)